MEKFVYIIIQIDERQHLLLGLLNTIMSQPFVEQYTQSRTKAITTTLSENEMDVTNAILIAYFQTPDLISTHRSVYTKLRATALSGDKKDVANAILITYFQAPELIGTDQYTITYDRHLDQFYKWDPSTLLWTPYTMRSLDKIYAAFLRNYTNDKRNIIFMIDRSNDEEFRKSGLAIFKQMNTLTTKFSAGCSRNLIKREIINKVSHCLLDECENISRCFSYHNDIVTELIPLNDGTMFNIVTHKSRMRTRQDCCTCTVNAHLSKNISTIKPANDSTDEFHKSAWNLLYDLMSRDEERTLFLIKKLATCLNGNINNHMIWVGNSNNGKSLLQRIMLWLLGKSCKYISYHELLSLKQSLHYSMLPTTRLRIIDFDDSEYNKYLLFSNVASSCIMSCNTIPQIVHDSNLTIIEFKTTFCNDIIPVSRFDGEIWITQDSNMEEKLKSPGFANALLTMLILATKSD